MKMQLIPLFFCLAILQLSGCATPTQKVERFASEAGFKRQIVKGSEFNHLIYSQNTESDASVWHVYIEHDGRPWINRYTISPDPTPRRPVMLKLMATDPAPSVYLGRPCYFEVESDQCNPFYWTSARYGESVVDSMAAVLTEAVPSQASIVLIGHSGGGTIAWLLASRLARVTALVTVAANLDIDAWTKYHGYSQLVHSLNPAKQKGLPESVHHIELLGGNDRNVPFQVISGFPHRSNIRHRLVQHPDVAHLVGWDMRWSGLLRDIN